MWLRSAVPCTALAPSGRRGWRPAAAIHNRPVGWRGGAPPRGSGRLLGGLSAKQKKRREWGGKAAALPNFVQVRAGWQVRSCSKTFPKATFNRLRGQSACFKRVVGYFGGDSAAAARWRARSRLRARATAAPTRPRRLLQLPRLCARGSRQRSLDHKQGPSRSPTVSGPALWRCEKSASTRRRAHSVITVF